MHGCHAATERILTPGGIIPPNSYNIMKKTELEELVKSMIAQIDVLNKRYTDEIDRLQQVINEYEREKGEYEQREQEDSEEERQERMEAHHAKILELFAERQEDESCPSIGDYADNHFI